MIIWTVERAARFFGEPAAGLNGVAKQHELRVCIAARQQGVPRVLHVVEDEGDEGFHLLFVGRGRDGRRGRGAGRRIDAAGVVEQREEVLAGGQAQDREEDHATDAERHRAADTKPAAAFTAAILEILTVAAGTPLHWSRLSSNIMAGASPFTNWGNANVAIASPRR